MFTITAAQIRGARAMLGWSMTDLAKAAGMSVSTVKRIEDGAPSPVVPDGTVGTARNALEVSGVRFLPDDGHGPGVRLRDR